MGLLLILVGAGFALLFVLNILVQTLRRQPKITFRDTLLAFLSALIPLAGLVATFIEEGTGSLARTALQVIGVVLALLSVFIVLLEMRRPEKLKNSRGIFGIGVGLLLLLASFTVPFTFTRVLAPALATATPIRLTEVSRVTLTVQPASTTTAPAVTPTFAVTVTPTLTRTLAPSVTPLATRFVFVTRTPEPTATLPNPCLALTEYNVNLRALPEPNAEIVLTVPFNITVTLLGRTEDSVWWFAQVEQKTGWLKGEFLTLSATCADLPVRAVDQ